MCGWVADFAVGEFLLADWRKGLDVIFPFFFHRLFPFKKMTKIFVLLIALQDGLMMGFVIPYVTSPSVILMEAIAVMMVRKFKFVRSYFYMT